MPVSQGTVIKSFVSAIDFLDQRDIDPNIYDVARDRAFTDIMKIVGRYKPCDQYTYHNFVNQDVRESCNVSAVTTTGAATIVFTVNTNLGMPRVGDLIKTSNSANAGKQALITAYNSSTGATTATSVDGTSLTVAISDKVTFGSNANGEKSDSPVNRRYSLTKYFNKIQIFREVDEISDVEKVSKIEVKVGGDHHILPYQHVQKVIKLNGDISVQMLVGVQSSASFSDSATAVQTTGGLDWYTTTYGISDAAGTLGTFGFTEIDEWVDNWIANKAPLEQMGFMGSRAYGLISKFLKNLGSSGVTSVRMQIDGKSFDFEVEQLKYRGATIDFVHVPIFDNPALFSSTLSPEINGSIYFVPKDQIDTVGGGRQGRMQIRYTPSPFAGANGSSNGIVKEWRTGALAEVPTSSVTQLKTDWYSAQGLECLGVKHFQKYRVI